MWSNTIGTEAPCARVLAKTLHIKSSVFPDWLKKHAPHAGALGVSENDEDVKRDHERLPSAMRMLADGDCEDLVHYSKPEQNRKCTACYLIALDSFVRLKCLHGFEALSSPETADMAKHYSGAKADKEYVANLPQICRSPMFEYEWCAIGIDAWSVGVCAGDMLKHGLKTYSEVILDGVHGIRRCVLGACASNRWTFFMIMKLLYIFNKAPWMSAKYLKEGRKCLIEALTSTPDAVKVLWDVLVPGIGRDAGDRELAHDQKRSDGMLFAMPDDKVVTAQGPRMSICGWSSYRYGALY